jgi:hypothetical protein
MVAISSANLDSWVAILEVPLTRGAFFPSDHD